MSSHAEGAFDRGTVPDTPSTGSATNHDDFTTVFDDETQGHGHKESVRTVSSPIEMTTIQSEIDFTAETYDPVKEPSEFCQFVSNPMFWGRIFTFIFSLILLNLSIAWCIAVQSSVSLELLRECDPMTPDQIWSHSYESAEIVDGQPVLSESSQFGITDDECITTKSIVINTDQLWCRNSYAHKWRHPLSINYKSVLFLLMVLYTLSVAIYTAWSMISDIIAMKHGKLHTKCSKYRPTEDINASTLSVVDPELDFVPRAKSFGESITSTYSKAEALYWRYMGYDTTGWIVLSISSEVLELVVQSQAMSLQNGYHPLRPDDLFLAQKPQFIQWFATILFTNACAAGISWLCYALAPGKCHGLSFLLAIFIIDQFCDLFYTLFPLIVVYNDDYNRNTHDILILLGQLDDDSNSVLSFIASFLPLVLLSSHLAMYSYYAQYELHEQYHAQYMLEKHLQPTLNKYEGRRTIKAMFDARKIATPYKSWIDTTGSSGRWKQSFLLFIAMIYFSFGIMVLVLTTKHIDNAKSHCDSVSESNIFSNGSFDLIGDSERELLSTNPELMTWEHCIYKVYPFTNDERHRCQCRVFVIDWSELESSASDRAQLNLTQNAILEGVLTHWTMLEKFQTTTLDQSSSDQFTFTPSMFQSIYMKAFEWGHVDIASIPSDISRWKQLEHLAFSNIAGLSLPDEIGLLSHLQSISIQQTFLSELPPSICNLENLKAMQMYMESSITSIPECVSTLRNLKMFLFDFCIYLDQVPFSVFDLPKLSILSLHRSAITYESLLSYNLPSDISTNDTESVDQWMLTNFAYLKSNDTEYWLSESPICSENITLFPQTLGDFLNISCSYPIEHDDDQVECPPWKWSDGTCDFGMFSLNDDRMFSCFVLCPVTGCYDMDLLYDGGDCIQSCLAEGVTGCTLDLLQNEICDESCNNDYCAAYQMDSTFETPEVHMINETYYASDFYQCPYEMQSNASSMETYPFCSESASGSIYIDPNVPSSQYNLCDPSWINDGFCDDSFRIFMDFYRFQ